MIRINVIVAESTTPANTLNRTLLDGASLYGVSMVASGRFRFPLYCIAVNEMTPEGPDYPAASDLRAGVTCANGTITGNMTEPPVNKVETGYKYGANGTEFTGTMAVGGGETSHVFLG